MGLRQQRTQFINVRIEEWIGPGLFLAFDRYSVDTLGSTLPTRAKLLEMTESDELYKLMGTTQKYLESISPLIADEYLKLGGVHRVTNPAIIGRKGATTSSSFASPPSRSGILGLPIWSDEDAEDAALVFRRTQEVQAQVRSSQNVRELKGLYRNSCAFCGKQTIIGVDPHRDYSEAAHIKPVGQPHNGPDRKDNMIVLCPEHHLQFDRGLLRIKQAGGSFLILSKIPGDPLDNSVLKLIKPHTVDPQFSNWHYNFWNT